MDHVDRRERPHFSEVAHEAVWEADDQTSQDVEHAQQLARLGFGFAGGRYSSAKS